MSIEQIRARSTVSVSKLTNSVFTMHDGLAAVGDREELLAAVDAVLALHQPEKRWEPYEEAGISFKTSTEAITAASEVDLGVCAETPASFEVCAECARIESEQLVEMGEDWGYRESLWPCSTVTAITVALEGTK